MPKLLLHKRWAPPSLPSMAGASSDKLANRILRGLIVGVVLGAITLHVGGRIPLPVWLQDLLVHAGIGSSATFLEAMRGVSTVLLDSVSSQANRLEEALLAAWEDQRIPLPVISVDFSSEDGIADLGRITSLQAPHRCMAVRPQGFRYQGWAACLREGP